MNLKWKHSKTFVVLFTFSKNVHKTNSTKQVSWEFSKILMSSIFRTPLDSCSCEELYKKITGRLFLICLTTLPVGIFLLKVNNRNSRTRCEICSKLTPCSSVSFVNSEQVNAQWARSTEALLKPCQTALMELFAKLVNYRNT